MTNDNKKVIKKQVITFSLENTFLKKQHGRDNAYNLVDTPCERSTQIFSEHAYIKECIHPVINQFNFFHKVLI